MPQLGETVTEGTVSAWHKKAGDLVKADEILLDVETDKVATEITAPVSGTIAEIVVQAGETVDVGTVLAVIEEAGRPEPAGAPAEAEQSASVAVPPERSTTAGPVGGARAASNPRDGDAPPLSPAVRRLLAEHGIAVEALVGTGKDGRITKGDVLEFIERQSGTGKPAPAASPAGGVKPFTRIRKVTAERMVQSKATSAHVLQAVEVDFSAVERVRAGLKDDWKKRHGFSLTYLPFISHAVCATLREFPDLNSSVRDDGLVLHGEAHLAIAVDLGAEGLVAPVIRSAGSLSVQELAQAINRLSSQARARQLKNDQLSGGSYTISNSGTFGTLITAPVINQPQVAILSVDGIRKRPVVVESAVGDAIAIRPVGILAQSFDHRAVDGAYSAAFLSSLRQRLEGREWSADL